MHGERSSAAVACGTVPPPTEETGSACGERMPSAAMMTASEEAESGMLPTGDPEGDGSCGGGGRDPEKGGSCGGGGRGVGAGGSGSDGTGGVGVFIGGCGLCGGTDEAAAADVPVRGETKLLAPAPLGDNPRADRPY